MPVLEADQGGLRWPPSQLVSHYAHLAELGAWWSGDPAQLAGVYTATTGKSLRFWARRSRDLPSVGSFAQAKARAQLHVPLAADVASISASLVMGTAPTVSWEDDENATELVGAQSEELALILVEAAEVCSALGGVWLRPAWDRTLSDEPFLTVVQPDAAWATWRMGRLVDVTFWEQLAADGRAVMRHTETHYTDDGWKVIHQLWRGTNESLGQLVPLTDHPDTAGLDERLGEPFKLGPSMGVAYVPNMRPNRRDRRSAEGRADVDGLEGMLDALDEAWTSWMRDLRLAKARIIVPESYLDTAGPGRGQTFDQDREIFTPIAVPTNVAKGNEMELVQPAIRWEAHQSTVLALVERIVSSAGFSPQDFGLNIEGRAESGTALRVRRQLSLQTVERKRRYWTPGLLQACWGLVSVARTLGMSPGAPPSTLPQVEWPEPLDLAEMASTVGMVASASAASTGQKVRWLHPDWSEEQIDAEVAEIRSEQGLGAPPELLP